MYIMCRSFQCILEYAKLFGNTQKAKTMIRIAAAYYRLFLDKIKRCDANSLGITSELV
jgi:hypothetical protein